MKKILTVLLSLFLIILPLAAGGTGESESSTGGSMTMTWWGGQQRHEQTQQLLDLYASENPGITIQGTPSNWDGYFEKLATQAASGSMPDIVQMDYLYIKTYASNGSLLDMTVYAENGVMILPNICAAASFHAAYGIGKGCAQRWNRGRDNERF